MRVSKTTWKYIFQILISIITAAATAMGITLSY